jgi:signal transduction histidine kinase
VIADFAARTAQNARLQGHLDRARVDAERRERERARLSDRLAHAEQGERRRLVDLLHDGPQQTVTSVSLMLDACLDAASDGDWEAMRRILSRARDRSRESIRDLRRLGSSVEPPVVHAAGLAAALEPLAARLAEDHDVDVLVEVDAARDLPTDVQALVYPIVREALANSLKHARPSQITVVAERVADGLAVIVADNGSGMLRTVAADGLGQGTAGICERAAALGGTVTWDAVPGGGTALRLLIPGEVQTRAA